MAAIQRTLFARQAFSLLSRSTPARQAPLALTRTATTVRSFTASASWHSEDSAQPRYFGMQSLLNPVPLGCLDNMCDNKEPYAFNWPPCPKKLTFGS